MSRPHLFLSLVSLLLAACAIGLRIDHGHEAGTFPAPAPVPRDGFHASATLSSPSPQFTVPAAADAGAPLLPNVDDPAATDPQAACPGYVASRVRETAHGFVADLDLAGRPCNVYGTDVAALKLVVEYQAADRLHVEVLPRYIGPENYTWFILPEEFAPRPGVGDDAGGGASDFELLWENDPSFAFEVRRRSSGDVLFSTYGTKLVFEDQFFEFKSALPENYNLYGLGEVIHGFRLGNNLTRTMFAADVGDPFDGNIYGTHPVYLDTRYFVNGSYVSGTTDPAVAYTSATHGVFLRNAHAQEVLLREEGITWRGLGGTIDLYFYSGPNATAAIKSYQESTVGLPAMQQYFSFGFHQCRWGYTSWADLQSIIDDFAKFEIPLETIWADIDYMNQYRDFENDQHSWSYEEAVGFFERLHAGGRHFVPIVDSAIYVPNPANASDAYPTYDRGVAAEAFMLNPDGSLYIGDVWPGYTVFPDWVGAVLGESKTFEWWTSELATWYQRVPFSGIWIDMSEVSSFCVGSCGSGNLTLNPVHPPFLLPGEPGNEVLEYPEGFNLTNATEAAVISSILSSLAAATATASPPPSTSTSYLRTGPTPGVRNVNYPPYVIDNIQGDLAVHAVSPNATHNGGTEEYDFHNLFGHQILNATYHALLSIHPEKRPFIIGRSTFAGSGKWSGHWGGDNASKWAYMFFSIPQALSFSIFGMPMFGVDTCGFSGNTDMELCSRWMQLSAFFPFYRNHNVLGAIPQEPFRWAAVAEASRAAMKIRYALLPYLYTAFWRAHTQGETVMRALAWEFPHEPWLADADRQFMLGDAILVTPCLVQGAETVNGVFPGIGSGTVWYDWYTHMPIENVTAGENVTIPAPLGHIPVYLRGGYVVPLQEPGMTTRESRVNPWGLLVPLDGNGEASGVLYVDDGESLVPKETLQVKFSVTNSSLTALTSGSLASSPLGVVTVMGIQRRVSDVKFRGQSLDKAFWAVNESAKALTVMNLSSATENGAWCSSWQIRWL